MATAFQAQTPPPPSIIHPPSTPRLGAFHDDYQPYSPRKSSRISERIRSAQTPPPRSGASQTQATPRSTLKRGAEEISLPSAPSSPQTASKKRTSRTSNMMGGRQVSGALNAESTSDAAFALGIPAPKAEYHRATAAVRQNGMLPTPDKTPKKAPGTVAPAIASIARNLFPVRVERVEDAMPPTKRRDRGPKKYRLDDFDEEGTSAPIAIFTDSHDRVPEVDEGLDNPFYGPGVDYPTAPVKRSRKSEMISIPGEDDQTLGEAEKREDGMIYVFRGKKMFKKFVVDEELSAGQNELVTADGDVDMEASSARGPTTRSSFKPRLLFPSSRAGPVLHNTEDEEADTDIEEPRDEVEVIGATPKAPRYAPASPPNTSRATRSRNMDFSSSPAAPTSDDEIDRVQFRTRQHITRKRPGTPIGAMEDKKLRR